MTRSVRLDDATIRALERHETEAHAIHTREIRDLGDALVLYDPVDPDPFWNRMVSVRWPEAPGAFDRRLNEALALFALLGRTPHIWPSPDHNAPPDIAARLEAHGFRDIGGGHLMILVDAAACPPLRPGELAEGVSVRALRGPGDALEPDIDAAALTLADGFGALPGRVGELAEDLRRTLDDPRVTLALARVDGEPAAVAKATTFDGYCYLSSIATRARFRSRGLAGLVTRHVVATGGGDGSLPYLGVFDGNEPALRLYDRLGFASIGVAPDLLLE